ncbi:MAG TPA: DUF177 domain-containing protein [Afifellaceae bacterium]|nr:DUF177 domain-containing protein [Afifellaceae bacterium]
MQPSKIAPFSLTIAVRDIGRSGRTEKLEADSGQRAALADLLGVSAIERLGGEFDLDLVSGGAVHLRGRIEADVVQTCVVSLEPVRQHIDEPVSVTLLPAESADGRPKTSVLVDPLDEDDKDTYSGGRIGLGTIVSEQLALHLDPYPRAPGVAFEPAGNDETDKRNSPFAVLERLKRDRG